MTRKNTGVFGNSCASFDPLYAEQIKLLYKGAPLAYAISIINGGILVLVQRPYISVSVLTGWYAILLLVTTGRATAALRFSMIQSAPHNVRYWNRIYLIGAGLSGSVWGSAAFLLFPPDSLVHQVFIAFVLAGMAAGGISVLAPRIEACLVYLLPVLSPLALRFFTLPSGMQKTMGAMTLLFLIGMVFTALNFHRAILSSLRFRFDKQELETEIVKRNLVQEELFQEKDRLQTTLGLIGEGVVLIDANGRIIYLNRAAEQLCGWNYQDALHRFAGDVFEKVENHDQKVTTAMEDSLRSARQVRKKGILFCKAGKRHIVEELATPMYDRHSKITGAVSVFRDVTEVQQETAKLAYAADHDALTGLPNRNLLKDRVRQAISRAHRKHETFTLLFLDLDRFKEVNDCLGHAAGDALLVDIAKRLTHCVREEDTVARLGGDEFVVVFDGPTPPDQLGAVADKILHALREPAQFGAQSINTTVSIGSSSYPNDGQTVEKLLEHADSAMYQAKKMGRDRLCMDAVKLP